MSRTGGVAVVSATYQQLSRLCAAIAGSGSRLGVADTTDPSLKPAPSSLRRAPAVDVGFRLIQVVELESAPLIERPHVREGVFRSRRILDGTPGTPGNFSLQLGVTPSYFLPRHRHNFDQVRFHSRAISISLPTA